jgi:hypothetical protein
LDVLAFDLGTPALRIRRTGRGWIVPLGLAPRGLNNHLLASSSRAPQANARDHAARTRPDSALLLAHG